MHKKFILLIVYCLLGCHSLLGQPKPYILKSPKPVSFESVLSGLSSYNFLIEEKKLIGL